MLKFRKSASLAILRNVLIALVLAIYANDFVLNHDLLWTWLRTSLVVSAWFVAVRGLKYLEVLRKKEEVARERAACSGAPGLLTTAGNPPITENDVLARGLPYESAVLYLRAFADDRVASRLHFLSTDTEEQQIARILSGVGPVVAVGYPDERVPELGAERFYLSHANWRRGVDSLLPQCALVAIRLGMSSGVSWELEHAVASVKPTRLVLLSPFNRREYDEFCLQMAGLFPNGLPNRQGGIPAIGSVRGVIWFDTDWSPHYSAVRPQFLYQTFTAPLESGMAAALQPTLSRVGATDRRRVQLLPTVTLLVMVAMLIYGLWWFRGHTRDKHQIQARLEQFASELNRRDATTAAKYVYPTMDADLIQSLLNGTESPNVRQIRQLFTSWGSRSQATIVVLSVRGDDYQATVEGIVNWTGRDTLKKRFVFHMMEVANVWYLNDVRELNQLE